jgi:hypothetical protein
MSDENLFVQENLLRRINEYKISNGLFINTVISVFTFAE